MGLAAVGIGIPRQLKAADEDPIKVGWNRLRDQFTFDPSYHYFNTGTMGLSPKPVIKAYKDAIDKVNSSGSYNMYKEPLQEAMAAFMGCDKEEIALTRNVTEGINIAAWAVPLQAGDEVILCTHEHAGNAIPWLQRAERDKLKIKLIPLGKNGNETLVELAKAFTTRTKVIALPHIPCTIGHILPIKEICQFAASRGCYSCIDGAHGAGMLDLDLRKMGCDFYAGCFHKWMLGPKGTGFLYIKKERLGSLNSTFVGAYSDISWDFSQGSASFGGVRNDSAMRHTYGTQSDALFAGALASIEFMNSLGMKKVEKTIKARGRQLCEDLLEIPELTVYASTTKKENGGIVTFSPNTLDHKLMAKGLQQEKFRTRIVHEAGLNAIRLSTHIYNSESEIKALVSTIKKIIYAN